MNACSDTAGHNSWRSYFDGCCLSPGILGVTPLFLPAIKACGLLNTQIVVTHLCFYLTAEMLAALR